MDSRKCQTATASPAEPGELPIGLGLPGSRRIKTLAKLYQPFKPKSHATLRSETQRINCADATSLRTA
jgi:hypothetical protein